MNGGKCYLSMCYILLRTNFTNCYRKRLIINLGKALTNVKFDTLNKPSGSLFFSNPELYFYNPGQNNWNKVHKSSKI